MNGNNYFEERDHQNIDRLREIRKELPDFCVEFFLGIETRTTPLTRLNYAYDLRIFFDFLTRVKFKGKRPDGLDLNDLELVDQTDIELFMEHLSYYKFNDKTFKCNDKAKERKLCSLRSMFKYFFNKDKLSRNIAAKVPVPKVHDKEIIRLEADEVIDILNNSESGEGLTKGQERYHEKTAPRDFAILTLLLGTGIRVSECVGLNVDDIDFSIGGFVVTRKGGNRVILYFSDEVAAALKSYLEFRQTIFEDICKRHKDDALMHGFNKEKALFISYSYGSRLSVRAVQELVKKYAKTAVTLKKITPHKLRSTYGTSLYRETKDIYIVADVLGHRDINTTKKHYAAISDDIRRAAANKVRLRDDADQPKQDKDDSE